MQTIYNMQREQPGQRIKEKTLISLCTMELTQTNIFSNDDKHVLTKKTIHSTFQNKINK